MFATVNIFFIFCLLPAKFLFLYVFEKILYFSYVNGQWTHQLPLPQLRKMNKHSGNLHMLLFSWIYSENGFNCSGDAKAKKM